jgi:hypothetical protein
MLKNIARQFKQVKGVAPFEYRKNFRQSNWFYFLRFVLLDNLTVSRLSPGFIR